MIFLISLFVSFLLLIVERLVGIDWDYHVDSVTYVESMDHYIFYNIHSIIEFSNNLHYFVVSLLGINGTIAYNILLTAVGNQIIYTKLIKGLNRNLQIFLILYLFNPYKLHLSTTLLKDSAIIFFLILTIFTKLSLLGVLLGGTYRNAFAFYLILHSKFRRYYFYVFIGVVSLYFYMTGFSVDSFSEQLTADMTFRDFDLVPNFTSFGAIYGSLLRMVLWPLITISGLFFFISPTASYFPLFIGAVSLILVYLKMKIKISEFMPFFLVMSFFAIIVPGYTTYFRYVFPLIALMPYIIILNNKSFIHD